MAPPTACPLRILPYRCSLTDCWEMPSLSAICRWFRSARKYSSTVSRWRSVSTSSMTAKRWPERLRALVLRVALGDLLVRGVPEPVLYDEVPPTRR